MTFTYLCVDLSGKEHRGTLNAQDMKEARGMLKNRGFSIVTIEQKSTSSTGGLNLKKSRITDNDLYNMSKELSVLLRAGLTIDGSLEIVSGSTRNAALKATMDGLLKDVRAGKSVATAFEESGRFSPLMVNVIRVGESVGDLKMAFEHIADHVRFQIKFKTDVKSALTYPAFLMVASVITLIVIFKFIVPQFFSIFSEGQELMLPFMARALFTLSKVTNTYVIAGTIITVVLVYKYAESHKLFHAAYSQALSLPLFNSLITNLELSRFSYAMYTMLSSGIEFIRALRFSTELIQNTRIRHSLEPALRLIKEGKGIADVFMQVGVLPDIMLSMIRVGEKSGNMKEIFHELFTIFDERLQRQVKRLVVLIEPAIILIMGIIVGFIVISLILTVMSVGNIKL